MINVIYLSFSLSSWKILMPTILLHQLPTYQVSHTFFPHPLFFNYRKSEIYRTWAELSLFDWPQFVVHAVDECKGWQLFPVLINMKKNRLPATLTFLSRVSLCSYIQVLSQLIRDILSIQRVIRALIFLAFNTVLMLFWLLTKGSIVNSHLPNTFYNPDHSPLKALIFLPKIACQLIHCLWPKFVTIQKAGLKRFCVTENDSYNHKMASKLHGLRNVLWEWSCLFGARRALIRIILHSFKGTMSLLQPTSNAVELCRNYEYVMYVLSVKFKR